MSRIMKQLDHLCWADQMVLQALVQANREPPDAWQIFVHIVAAEHVWLRRIQGRPADVAVWPELEESSGGCEAVSPAGRVQLTGPDAESDGRLPGHSPGGRATMAAGGGWPLVDDGRDLGAELVDRCLALAERSACGDGPSYLDLELAARTGGRGHWEPNGSEISVAIVVQSAAFGGGPGLALPRAPRARRARG